MRLIFSNFPGPGHSGLHRPDPGAQCMHPCKLASDSAPAQPGFPEIRLYHRDSARPGLRLNSSRGWEAGCSLSPRKSPLTFGFT